MNGNFPLYFLTGYRRYIQKLLISVYFTFRHLRELSNYSSNTSLASLGFSRL